MVLGKAPESHVQDGKKLLRCASCANATASGDPAMTIKSLCLAAGTWARPGLPGSAIASRTRQKQTQQAPVRQCANATGIRFDINRQCCKASRLQKRAALF